MPDKDIIEKSFRYKLHEERNKTRYRAAVFTREDEVTRFLLLKRSENHHRDPKKWEFPGGKPEIVGQRLETLEETLKHEIKEEIGLNFSEFGEIIQPPHHFIHGGKNILTVILKLNNQKEVKISKEEHLGFVWVTKEEALKMELRDEAREAIEALF